LSAIADVPNAKAKAQTADNNKQFARVMVISPLVARLPRAVSDRSSIFTLSHFRTKNRIPPAIKPGARFS
jgi:hypothetical protein